MQFVVRTNKREEILDITKEVQALASRFSIKEGLCNVFVTHATAALTIMENASHFRDAEKEDSFSSINENMNKCVCEDFLDALEKIAPKGKWKHDKVDENANAQIKAALVGSSLTIPIQNNRLMLGTWQGIMLCEFDGPRERNVVVNCVKIQ